MSESSPRRRFVTIADAASHLGVTPRSIRNYIGKGLFPAYRIPGTRGVRLLLDQIDEAMKMIPATVARPGFAQFGPKAQIIQVRRRTPEPSASDEATQVDS